MAKEKNVEKYRKKIKTKRVKQYSLFSILAFVILIILSLFALPNKDTGFHEITEEDVFQDLTTTSRDISVFGVKLGDTPEQVNKLLGKPDITTPYEPNILNIEYSESLDMEDIGLLIHFESGIVTRITIMAPFNKYLQDSTRIQYTKDQLFNKFGKPDESVSSYPFKEYNYDTQGITFIIDKNQQVGMSFYL